jgi:hypothetical protein
MPKPDRSGMTTIEIFVDKNGVLTYDDYETVVHAGTKVCWTCKSHDYGIQFTNNASPFDEQVFSFSKVMGNATDPCTAKHHGRGLLKFKYTVSVHIPGGAQPIVIDDPVIIVDDG